MKKLLFVLMLLPSLVGAMPTVIVDGKLSWTAPTTMIDDTPIVGDMTYAIYCSGSANSYSQITEVSTTEIPLKDLALTGYQTCVVTAKVDLMESAFSNAVNFTCTGRCLSGKGPVAPAVSIK